MSELFDSGPRIRVSELQGGKLKLEVGEQAMLLDSLDEAFRVAGAITTAVTKIRNRQTDPY